MKTVLNQKRHDPIPDILPVIPTMDVVVFPHMIVPLLVLDEKIINGINHAIESSKMVMLLAAKEHIDKRGSIGTNDLYHVGTIATIMRLIKIPEGGVKILVQGLQKASVQEIVSQDEMLHARIHHIAAEQMDNETLTPHIRNLKSIAEKITSAGGNFSPDFHIIISKMTDPEKIADFILSHLNLSVKQAQELLETEDYAQFLESLYHYLSKEVHAAEIQERVRASARESMNEAQKEFYLREQLKAIKRELGEDDAEEIEMMREKLQHIEMPEEIKKDVRRQINRLERTAPDSLEATVTRNHLEWIFALPWSTQTEDNLDIKHALNVLNEDHYGLKDIKERILDFISIRNLKRDGFAPILCFVGPPGTGKTSLGKSIAKSLGRKYARIALGGVKDEAEIRGHRRTYVGAMPGRFIQAMRKAGSLNPVVIIDELDKIGSDFRGDPSAAMLELLDPQQNKTFYDNYLGIPFDLSNVMFIATANRLDTISGPLRDRMEIVKLSGYTLDEKVNICKQHLVDRAVEDTGLTGQGITFTDEVISSMVEGYTRESGVRQLERLVKTLCSKAARSLVENKTLLTFTPSNIDQHLGPRTFRDDDVVREDQVGISNGLAWTAFGGEMIKIEAVLMPGRGKLILTGQLGDVMKESAQAALTYARAHAKEFGINHRAFTANDLHIHVPAGAIPKDGPSAGITMLTAILSAFTNKPINSCYAMTGELNLCGEVMPIGGVKEKILAAKRNNIPHIILPDKNKSELVGLEEITTDVNIIWVKHAREVLEHVLTPVVKPKRLKAA